MWDFLKNNAFVIGGLTGSLAAYLLGLLVSHIRRERRWLVYSVRSRNIVRADRPELRTEYKGQPVTRLDSHSVVLRNTGNRALSTLPVQIIAPRAKQIVEYDVSLPDGASFTAEQKSDTDLRLAVDLLNPGELATVGVTVTDSKDGNIKIIVRTAGLIVKEQDPDYPKNLISFNAVSVILAILGAIAAVLANVFTFYTYYHSAVVK